MEALRTLLEAIYQVYARLTRARVITLGLEQQNMGTSGPPVPRGSGTLC